MVSENIDAIVVLGAGYERVYERIEGAKSVYKLMEIKGRNPLIIFSGYDVGEQDVQKLVEELKNSGYKTIVESSSRSTRENAENLKIVLKKLEEKGYSVNSVTVVTDNKHSLRVRGIFGSDLDGKKVEYVVVKDNRFKDFIYELLAIPFTIFHIDDILTRKYR
jgi:uncharacterized SAM-binding protein YcdF (DUF218 family)